MDVEKYRLAGIIAQSGLLYAIRLLHKNFGEQTLGSVCRLVDEFLADQVKKQFKTVEEKGIAQPTEICKGDFVSGISPEKADTYQGGIAIEGDLITISLGVHIDGYTALGSHTVIVREQVPDSPAVGPDSDAEIAAYLAVEALVSLLSIPLTADHPLHDTGVVDGNRIRTVVESIATAFNCVVVPGSRVRLIKRFVVGQTVVQERDSKAVEWHEYEEGEKASVDESWEVKPNHAYLIDISMASKQDSDAESHVKFAEFSGVGATLDKPSIYSRDFTMSYHLKSKRARELLAKADKQSVYPFKLSYLDGEYSQSLLGLQECIQRRLLVPHPRLQAKLVTSTSKKGRPVNVAREGTTVVLVGAEKSASGFPELLRLCGGKQLPPSWTHSSYELPDGDAAQLLNARVAKHGSFKYIEVVGRTPQSVEEAKDEAMAE